MSTRFSKPGAWGVPCRARVGLPVWLVLLWLTGCATGTPVGFRVEARNIRYRPVGTSGVREAPPAPTVDSRKVAVLPERLVTSGATELQGYKDFIRGRREALRSLPEEERRLEEAVLREMEWWLWQQDEALLARRHPVELHSDLLVARRSAERKEAARRAAVEAKLEEYLRWGMALAQGQARLHFRRVGREYLLTESPLWEAAQNELGSAVLAWAYRHTEDPDFLRKSPSEVALYLLASRSVLANALVVGSVASPHADHTPLRDKTPEEEEDDEARELLVGLVPVVGEVADFSGLITGYSPAGRRHLTRNERLLCAVGVLLPLLSARALSTGGEALEQVALATGRSLDEVHVMVRVAERLAPEDAQRIRHIALAAARTGQLTDEEWHFLRHTSRYLEQVLDDFHAALKRGEKVPLLAVRKDAAGLRLVPGSPEHLAQAWVEYQFRHPEKYGRFRYAPDTKWQRMYRTVLENKGKGSDFEQAVLKSRGHEKNSALMLPPPGSKARGFIPDAVPGNPNPGELVWGQAYRFVEAKARQELALTGNLEAMLDYVKQHGGHIELWIRSTKHPEGATRLTGPLQRALNTLADQGRATVKSYP